MTKKINFYLFSVLLLVMPIAAAFASFPFDSDQYLNPPAAINLTFDKVDFSKYPVFLRSGFFDAVSGKMTIDVNDNGEFTKTIEVANKAYSSDRFAADSQPEPGIFTLSGKYKKGQISSEWTYALSIPPIKDWKFPASYKASGVFYTTQPISENSGMGIIEGEISSTETEWKDNEMKEYKEVTGSGSIRNTWVATSQCIHTLCGCFDYKDAEDSFARFNSVTGVVGYAHCNKDERTDDWIPATPKTKLLVGDHISTDQDSYAVLQFKDMTTFKLKPETEVIVNSPPEQETKLGLVAGHMWINFKKMLANGTMEVEMGQAVAGIKGTTLVVEQINGVSTLKVIEGVVSFKSKVTGESVDVAAGEKVSADMDGMSATEKFDAEAENASWSKLDEMKPLGASQPRNYLLLGAVVFVVLAVLVFAIMKFRKKKINS